jgi:hypothetical protein
MGCAVQIPKAKYEKQKETTATQERLLGNLSLKQPLP